MAIELEPWQEVLIVVLCTLFGGGLAHTLRESECSSKAGQYKFTFNVRNIDQNGNGIDDDLEAPAYGDGSGAARRPPERTQAEKTPA